MKPNIVIGWLSPRFAVWTVLVEDTSKPLWCIVLLGVLRWLRWCLPFYHADATGEGYRFLAFILNVVHGPYACAYCGRATTQPPNLTSGVPSHCSRDQCFNAAIAIENHSEACP